MSGNGRNQFMINGSGLNGVGFTNGRLNELALTNGGVSGSGGPTPASTFGQHQFQSNLQAHTYINTALNQGGGHVGTVARAEEVNSLRLFRQPPDSQRNGSSGRNQRLTSATILQSHPVPLHPFNGSAQQPVPSPASHLLVVAEVRRRRGSGRNRELPGGYYDDAYSSQGSTIRSVDSDLFSQSSMDSFGSPASQCSCCTGCLCHHYCSEHAHRYCPVHGLGLPESQADVDISPINPFV